MYLNGLKDRKIRLFITAKNKSIIEIAPFSCMALYVLKDNDDQIDFGWGIAPGVYTINKSDKVIYNQYLQNKALFVGNKEYKKNHPLDYDGPYKIEILVRNYQIVYIGGQCDYE